LLFSIKPIFQRFNDVSRWTASVMSTYSSYQTSRYTPAGEAGALAGLVLGHPASKVVGDTDIDRAASWLAVM